MYCIGLASLIYTFHCTYTNTHTCSAKHTRSSTRRGYELAVRNSLTQCTPIVLGFYRLIRIVKRQAAGSLTPYTLNDEQTGMQSQSLHFSACKKGAYHGLWGALDECTPPTTCTADNFFSKLTLSSAALNRSALRWWSALQSVFCFSASITCKWQNTYH